MSRSVGHDQTAPHIGVEDPEDEDCRARRLSFADGAKQTTKLKIQLLESSLSKLFECLTLECSCRKLVHPQWKHFKNMKMLREDRIRLSNAIWRCWHIQYQKGRKPKFCGFVTPLTGESHDRSKAVVLEGKYWRRRLVAVSSEYKKWRVFFKERIQGVVGLDRMDDKDVNVKSNESMSSDHGLFDFGEDGEAMVVSAVDEHDLNTLSDTLFTSFQYAKPRLESGDFMDTADTIQPSLGRFQPSLDDLMNSFSMPGTGGNLSQMVDALSGSSVVTSGMGGANSTSSHTVYSQAPPVSLPSRRRSLPALVSVHASVQDDWQRTTVSQDSMQGMHTQITLPPTLQPLSPPHNSHQGPPPALCGVAQQLSHVEVDVKPPLGLLPPHIEQNVPVHSVSSTLSAPVVQSPAGAPDRSCHQQPMHISNPGNQGTTQQLVDLIGNPDGQGSLQHFRMLLKAAGEGMASQPTSTPQFSDLSPLHPKPVSLNLDAAQRQLQMPKLAAKTPTSLREETVTPSIATPSFQLPSTSRPDESSPQHQQQQQNQQSTSTAAPGEGRMPKSDDAKARYREQRRKNHITAEQKRRVNIRNGFDELQALIPSLSGHATKVSKAVLLQKAVEHMKQLQQQRQIAEDEADGLRTEISMLNESIMHCQEQLPVTGAPVTRTRLDQTQQLFLQYVQLRTQQNYKFWIFSMIIKSLFDEYNNSVSTSSVDEMCRSILSWFDQHCSLRVLRPAVLSSLRQLSTSTSILVNPSRLPEEAVREATRAVSASVEAAGVQQNSSAAAILASFQQQSAPVRFFADGGLFLA